MLVRSINAAPGCEPRRAQAVIGSSRSLGQHEGDARRFLDELRARFEAFALSLHPGRTRLIEFGRLAAAGRARRGLGKPETFDFLGFTFICSVSRRGSFLLKRKTRRDRLRAKLGEIKEDLRRHQPIPEQGRRLAQVVRGYFAYHAVPTNYAALGDFRAQSSGSGDVRSGGAVRQTIPCGPG